MPDILHRVGIQSPGAGGVIQINPDGGGFDMKVVECSRELVKWSCVGGPPEWIGTEISFRLVSQEAQVFVLFTHANWREPVEFMHHCSTKWGTFMLSLKNWIERAEGRPHPWDVKIHVGD